MASVMVHGAYIVSSDVLLSFHSFPLDPRDSDTVHLRRCSARFLTQIRPASRKGSLHGARDETPALVAAHCACQA